MSAYCNYADTTLVAWTKRTHLVTVYRVLSAVLRSRSHLFLAAAGVGSYTIYSTVLSVDEKKTFVNNFLIRSFYNIFYI